MSQNGRVSLIYGLTGQTVDFYPPEKEVRELGAPASGATYSIWRGESGNDESAVLSGTATLDSVSTVVATTAAGYSATDRRLVTLSATTGISVAYQYVIANASGQREIVRPYNVGSSTIYVENDLAYDYPVTTSTFKGLRHYFTIDATFIQEVGNINVYGNQPTSFETNSAVRTAIAPPYRVRWSYTTGSTSQQFWTYFDVVRARLKHNVTLHDLREFMPDIADLDFREQRGQGFQKQIDAGYEEVLWHVRAAGYDEDRIREGPMLDQLVRQATMMKLAEIGIGPGQRDPESYVRDVRDKFYQMKADAFGGSLHMWIDTGSVGAIEPDPPRQMRWRR